MCLPPSYHEGRSPLKRSIRGAICRIDVLQDGKSLSRGTGTLVAPGIVLTALNVVADRHTSPPRLFSGLVTLTFPGHKTISHVHGMDPRSDWVLLVCETAPPAIPVPIGKLTQSHVEWESHGFPDTNPVEGESGAGMVEDYHGSVEGVAAFQLTSLDVVAVSGAPVKGLAGAPVIVAGWMVGHLRNARLEDGPDVVGTVYACPAATIAARFPELLPLGEVGHRRSATPVTPPRRWRRWAVVVGGVFAVLVLVLLFRR